MGRYLEQALGGLIALIAVAAVYGLTVLVRWAYASFIALV